MARDDGFSPYHCDWSPIGVAFAIVEIASTEPGRFIIIFFFTHRFCNTERENQMTNPFENENDEYLVLVNHEEQYSLWPAFREVPAGWKTVGPNGKRKECLDWIEANWTDMRPKSLVDAMAKNTCGSLDVGNQTTQDPPLGCAEPSG